MGAGVILELSLVNRLNAIASLCRRSLSVPWVGFRLNPACVFLADSATILSIGDSAQLPPYLADLSFDSCCIPNTHIDRRTRAVHAWSSYRFYAQEPLLGPDGKILGCIILAGRSPRRLRQEQQLLLADFSALAASILTSDLAQIVPESGLDATSFGREEQPSGSRL